MTHRAFARRDLARSDPIGLVVRAGALGAAAVSAHAAVNLRHVRRLPERAQPVRAERVSVLLPVRNEAHRLDPCLDALRDQRDVDDLEIVVIDDGSTDGTDAVLARIAASDPRITVIGGRDGGEPPAGWRGKPWACHRLAQAATGSVLVFVDADVVLQPYAVAAAVRELRAGGWSLVSPYPRQVAITLAERITQPLVTWYWISIVPMALATSRSRVFTAAIGQFLVFDTADYRAAGGHAAVADAVVDDIAIAQLMKAHGFRTAPMDGTAVASCRMYESVDEVWEGYGKSLWTVFDSTPNALAAAGGLLWLYVLPPLLGAVSRDRRTRAWGLLGYAAGVAGRMLVARRTGERVLPDPLAHPVSAGAYATLIVASLVRRRWGSLSWKGRAI